MSKPQNSGRPLEIEEWSNRYVIHAVAKRLVPTLAKHGVSPNAVSVTGLIFSLAAAGSYYTAMQTQYGTSLWWALGGLCGMLIWHICDGLDGQLARLSGKASEFGRIIDGICDHLAFGAVYMAIALSLSDGLKDNWWIWPLGLTASAVHAIQAAAFERRRQIYRNLVAGHAPLKHHTPGKQPNAVMQSLANVYDKAQELGDKNLKTIEKRTAGQPPEAIKKAIAPLVKRWSLLSANHRTFALFIFISIGWPDGYFWFEIVGLSIVFSSLLRQEKKMIPHLHIYFSEATNPAKAS